MVWKNRVRQPGQTGKPPVESARENREYAYIQKLGGPGGQPGAVPPGKNRQWILVSILILALVSALGVMGYFAFSALIQPSSRAFSPTLQPTEIVAPLPDGWKTFIDPTREYFLYYPEKNNQKVVTLFHLTQQVPVEDEQTLVLTDDPASTMQYAPPSESLRVMVWKNPGKSLTFDEWVVSMSVGEASVLRTETIGKCIASSATVISKEESVTYRWLDTHVGYLGLMVKSRGSPALAKTIADSFISATCIGNH